MDKKPELEDALKKQKGEKMSLEGLTKKEDVRSGIDDHDYSYAFEALS